MAHMLLGTLVPARHRHLAKLAARPAGAGDDLSLKAKSLGMAANRRHHLQRIHAQAALAVGDAAAAFDANERVGDDAPAPTSRGIITGAVVAHAEDQCS